MEKRNHGIDLLRLILMFMVCLLHTLGHGGILNASVKGSISYNVFWFIEILSYGAVDAFALISGYASKNKPQRYDKIINIWFQIFFYSFILTVLFTIVGINKNVRMTDMITSAFPITYNKFWYMTAYFALFFTMPIINNFMINIDEKTAKKTFIIMFVLFSLIGFINDSFCTISGYSTIWLMILYCLGALAKKINLFEKKKTITLIIMWGICIISTWILRVYFGYKNMMTYISQTILLSAILMVVLFSRIKLKGNVISKLAPLVLGVYLFQLNPVIWNGYIKNAFIFVAYKNIVVAVLLILLFSGVIFGCGLIVEMIRNKISNIIKIELFSRKIGNLIEKLLNRIAIVLK